MDAISVNVMALIEDFCVLVNGIGAVGQGRHFLLIIGTRSDGDCGGKVKYGRLEDVSRVRSCRSCSRCLGVNISSGKV